MGFWWVFHGSLNVPIEHHPTIRYMVYNGYYKVMSNIPKMGQLPTPVFGWLFGHPKPVAVDAQSRDLLWTCAVPGRYNLGKVGALTDATCHHGKSWEKSSKVGSNLHEASKITCVFVQFPEMRSWRIKKIVSEQLIQLISAEISALQCSVQNISKSRKTYSEVQEMSHESFSQRFKSAQACRCYGMPAAPWDHSTHPRSSHRKTEDPGATPIAGMVGKSMKILWKSY